MDELRLAIPDESLLDEIAAYRQAMLDADSSMDGCGPLKRMENPAEWLAFCRQLDNPATTPPNWVPMTQFVCLRGRKIVGMIQVRRELNDFLREYAGHIGYSVRPDERKKGVATWMLQNSGAARIERLPARVRGAYRLFGAPGRAEEGRCDVDAAKFRCGAN